MDKTQIIAQIDAEIARLQEVRRILSGGTTIPKTKRGPKTKTIAAKKRILSPEARARIAAAQKARWAKTKKAANAA